MAITATSLRHPVFLAKIDAAMRRAAKNSQAHGLGYGLVYAADGAISMSVRHVRGGRYPSSLMFVDVGADRDITPMVLAALRHSVEGERA